MLAITFCKDSDPTDPSDKGNFRSFLTMHSSRRLDERARPEVELWVFGLGNDEDGNVGVGV
jgi:hypothetical protein